MVQDGSDAAAGLKSSGQLAVLMRGVADALLDPLVLLEATRDCDGQVADFVFSDLNQATCDYLQVPPEKLLGISLRAASPGAAAAALFGGFVRCLETGEAVVVDDLPYQNALFRVGARRYDVRATRVNPTAICLTWRDVTDRFKGAQVLAEARSLQHKADLRYRRLMDHSGIGMGLLSADGTFETVNKAMCDFFGYDAETLCSKTYEELTGQGYEEEDLRNANALLSGSADSYRMEKQYIHADGRLLWGDLTVSCLRTPDGEVENFVGQVVDITEAVHSRGCPGSRGS